MGSAQAGESIAGPADCAVDSLTFFVGRFKVRVPKHSLSLSITNGLNERREILLR